MRKCIVKVKVQLASYSVLFNICKTIKSQGLQAFADIEGHPNPSIITADKQRPDFAIVKNENLLL